jgi:hypothetical protein
MFCNTESSTAQRTKPIWERDCVHSFQGRCLCFTARLSRVKRWIILELEETRDCRPALCDIVEGKKGQIPFLKYEAWRP